jgi:hypothetical protein
MYREVALGSVMLTPGTITASIVVLVLLFNLLFAGFVLRRILSYRLTDGSVQVVFFGSRPVSTTSYDRIEEVRQITWAEVWRCLHARRAANRLNGPFVMIHTKGGLPVVISPANPGEFIRELRQRAYQRTGELLPVS